MSKRISCLLVCVALLLLGVAAVAQESAVKGNIGGIVTDTTGAVVPGAKVTLTGSAGNETAISDGEGNFLFTRLNPGLYNVKVEKQGFKATDAKGIEVTVGHTASMKMKLEPGAISETVEVSASAVTVDTTATASGANLNDQFYESVPVPRNVSGLFYVAPGVADSGGAGRANPSISGGSGLENMYVADGVNITDAAFGGLGNFTRQYGSMGTGINLSFIKEVQVKTGAFEPQYGQATGGVVQIVTKAGGDQYHGQIAGYFAPTFAEAAHPAIDTLRNRKVGTDLLTPLGPSTGLAVGAGSYDASAEFGGYIPHFRNNLFFFGSYNPKLDTDYSQPPQFAGSKSFLNNLGITNPPQVGLFTLLGGRPIYTREWTNSYAGKLTYRLNSNNTVETSIFGDPSNTNNSAFRAGAVIAQNTTGYSALAFQTRNFVTRYNGTLSPTWLFNANVTWAHSEFTETPQNPNVFGINNSTTSGLSPLLQGLGLVENYVANDFAYNLDTSKSFHLMGQHTVSLGFSNLFLNYDDLKSRTGGRFPVPDLGAARNQAVYGCAAATGAIDCPLGFMTNAAFVLNARPSCTLCPLMVPAAGGAPVPVALNTARGEYGPAAVQTEGKGYAAYINDSWTVNKYVSLQLGLRAEQYRMVGVASAYSFTDNWAPRLGIVVDPRGDRKSKLYANFARYNYQMPLDAAIRSLSNELDLGGIRYAPASTAGVVNINPDGSINVIPDAAHMMNLLRDRAGDATKDPTVDIDTNTGKCINPLGCGSGGPTPASFQNTTGFAAGTKMQYEDEWIAGYEHDFGHGMIFSARYLDRRLRRIVEDLSGVSPEGSLAGLNQQFLIGNPLKTTDLFKNEVKPTIQNAGAPCTGTLSAVDAAGFPFANGLQACWPGAFDGGEVGSDGLPDGFANPVRNYQAVEIELNKSFSKGWLMRVNYRIARLQGNYEGAFRNDNAQTDPSISSLFDFTPGALNLLGDQFAIGPLNTDRRGVANGFFSYTFDHSMFKGLTLGTGIRVQSGTPVSEFANHPVYGNSGEVPLGGRGKLGRTPLAGQVDMHSEYAHKLTERYSLHFGADLFNVTDSQPVTRFDQNRDLNFQAPFSNTDFQSITGYQFPFYARFSVKVSF